MNDACNRTGQTCLTWIVLCLVACNPQQSVTPIDGDPVSMQGAPHGPAAAPVEVLGWGPRSTPADTPFNIQADGNSGLSFQLSGRAPAGNYVITLDGRPLTGVVVSGELVTATIPREYLARSGTFPLIIRNTSRAEDIMSDQFVIEAP